MTGAVAQSAHWDPVTAQSVLPRLGPAPRARFFTPREQAVARRLFDLIVGQEQDERRIPVMEMVDERLASGRTDGWRHADSLHDGAALKASLAALDAEGQSRFGVPFERLPDGPACELLGAVQRSGDQDWHGGRADRVWALWTRCACVAFYSHPRVWDEIGFGGPAYPRGYGALGLDAREPWESGGGA